MTSMDPKPQINVATHQQYLLTDLPTEIILTIAKYLAPTDSDRQIKHLVRLSQTCRRLRGIAYPMANRHMWFDEETQYPDTMLSIVNHSFTDSFVEFVQAATFRLRAEGGYWLNLTESEDNAVEEQMRELRGHLRRKAEEGNEVFQFFESQLKEYGIATLATILLYQLKGLREIELACSTGAISSRFMLTTLCHFEPPFRLERLGTARLADFAASNYWLLERFLRLGVPTVGIDYRFGSTGGFPKVKPVTDVPTDEYETPDTSHESSQDSLSEGLTESEYKISIPWRQRADNSLSRTVYEEIEQDYKGYEPLDHWACGYETGIKHETLGFEPSFDHEKPFLIKNLRIWLDETPSLYEPLLSPLLRVKGLRQLDLNLFPLQGIQVFRRNIDTTNFECFTDMLADQKETLESLSVRISRLGAPQPRIPLLAGFENLRRVHLFYGTDVDRNFKAAKRRNVSYFQEAFPPRLESLRLDIFEPYWIFGLMAQATRVPTQDFPSLKITMGFAKEGLGIDVLQRVYDMWASLPYWENPATGEWTTVMSTCDAWRRYDLYHVPVLIVAHNGSHKDVPCSNSGWYGPFQEQNVTDAPFSSVFPIGSIDSKVADDEAGGNTSL